MSHNHHVLQKSRPHVLVRLLQTMACMAMAALGWSWFWQDELQISKAMMLWIILAALIYEVTSDVWSQRRKPVQVRMIPAEIVQQTPSDTL